MESEFFVQNIIRLLTILQNYFNALQNEGSFDSNILPDQIALLAIYIPLLRTEMQSFTRTWNSHRIRKQPNRPNVVAGKPYVLYHHTSEHVRNYGLSVDMEQLKRLQNDVRDWGEFLSPYEIFA